ncbi:VOC family protein [Pedobacter sp. ISL-68]|uniref:VOC family protein n=1 Tax=unclassified Pedobacter TaxID=2628915 RepID=UPI001BE87778|nr:MULTISPECIES: VOC family protein [unclassified Pedobacter]MBT2560643.1 VOC family protein [Pedobacter sp. ISL-64]MBT2590022.1 VOC family protein [Pedobacter sp. ISL-68]
MKTKIKLLFFFLAYFYFTNEAIGQEKYRLFGMAISVQNLEESIKWYHDVLGFKLVERSEYPIIHAKTAFVEGAGIRLELLEVEESFRLPELFADPPKHMQLIGNKALILYVDNLTAITKELEKKKVAFAFKEAQLNNKGLKSTIIRDPDGNFISIFSKKGMIKINQSK